jgi:hypothetical protein
VDQDDKTFRFYIPAEFEKASDGRRLVRGFVTTEHRDREKEKVLQAGLDFTEFLRHGWFNDNHSKSTKSNLGWPLKLEPRDYPDGKKGHYVEGEMMKNYRPADEIWDLAEALKANKAPRQLGFSIEGTIDEREDGGKTISKARVRNVAITANPVNPYAGLEPVMKALTAGAEVSAPPAAPGQGFPLRTESLERKKKKKKKRKSCGEHVDALVKKGMRRDNALKAVLLAIQLKRRKR